MHTYRKWQDKPMETTIWTVGYYLGDDWQPLSDHSSENAARKEVNYLNGGNSVITTYVETP
jgi:hypothetical protein